MKKLRTSAGVCWAALFLAAGSLLAQGVNVSGRVEVKQKNLPGKGRPSASVVWLTPLSADSESPPPAPAAHPKLLQKDKKFDPHLLVVPAGTLVDFPNRDPFFHNVFSLFEGKRFDLGLYEAGSTRSVHFNRAGVSYIFCNIHPEMSAVVIALKTPYYAVSKPGGSFSIPNVPAGRYQLQVWHEGASLAVLKSLVRIVDISIEANSLPVLQVPEDDSLQTHKNKYGHDYDPSTSSPYEPEPR